MNFDQAFEILVDPQHEGGYVNDPRDPGGETKYGISKRSYPMENIAGMTLERAKAIYARDFWGPAGCDSVPDLLKYELFDFAVNTSAPGHPVTAIKVLQLAAGSDVDGVLGPNTLLRVQGAEPGRLFRRFIGYAIQYYTHIPPERRDRYLAGWMNRVADNLLRA
jgi:lysozyme family protein